MTRRISAAVLAVALVLPGAGWSATPPAPSPVVQIPAGNDVTAGTPADAAYSGSGSATLAAALKGIYAALQGIGTAANQSSEIAQLTTANQRATDFTDIGPGTAAASGTLTGANWHDSGAAPSVFTKIFAQCNATGSGTCVLLGSDNAGSTVYELATMATTTPAAGLTYSTALMQVPRVMRYYNVRFINGSSSVTLYAKSGATTN